MSNPFLGTFPHHSQPTYITDHYGSTLDEFTRTPWHVAGLMFLALVVITAMKLAGFRAMVGIGR